MTSQSLMEGRGEEGTSCWDSLIELNYSTTIQSPRLLNSLDSSMLLESKMNQNDECRACTSAMNVMIPPAESYHISSLNCPAPVTCSSPGYQNASSDIHFLDPDSSQSLMVPTDDDLKQIEIKPYEVKQDFKEEQFDVLLVYSETDRDMALSFREILIKFIRLENGNPPSICVLDRNTNLTYITSRFSHMEEALKRSTYMFLLVTKSFCEDSWAQLQRDECLMESVENIDKKWCVVPILTKPRREADYTMPFGLRALKGVEISRMLVKKTLTDVDVELLTESDVDRYFLKNMTKMLNDRIYMKIERMNKQLKQFQEWLKEERHQRWIKQQKEETEIKQAESRRLKERQSIGKQHLDQRHTAEEAPTDYLSQIKLCPDFGNSEKLGTSASIVNGNTEPELNQGHGVTVHHHYYYEKVTQAPTSHTVYNIHGPIAESMIGSENFLKIEKSCDNVNLGATNQEIDESEVTEYVVETKSSMFSSTGPNHETIYSRQTDCGDPQLTGPPQKPRDSFVSSADVSLNHKQFHEILICPDNSELKENNSLFLKTSPEITKHLEVDLPVTPSSLSASQSSSVNIPGEDGISYRTPVREGSDISLSQIIHASNSMQDVLSIRPIATVNPIYHKSSPPTASCKKFEEREQEEETRMKCYIEEETRLKCSMLGGVLPINGPYQCREVVCDGRNYTNNVEPVFTKNSDTKTTLKKKVDSEISAGKNYLPAEMELLSSKSDVMEMDSKTLVKNGSQGEKLVASPYEMKKKESSCTVS